LVSNILEFFVRYPTPAVEELVVPAFDEEVATYFAFRGVHGLPGADKRLAHQFLDGRDKPDLRLRHPLLHSFCAHEAELRQDGAFACDAATRTVTVQKRPRDALFWYARAFGLTDLNDLTKPRKTVLHRLPFSNLDLNKLRVAFRAELLRSDRKRPLADSLTSKLNSALEIRGVPARMRRHALRDTEPRSSSDRRGGE
jgi:hypothetical protein